QQQKTHTQGSHTNPLPTAFSPNFPSLFRPSQPTQYVPPKTTRALLTSRNNRNTRQRTLYLGPGHSLMSNSTRLASARRNRYARAAALPDPPQPPQSSEETGSQDLPSSKRIKHNQPRSNSVLATPQAAPQPIPLPHSSIINPSLKAFANHAGTPVRPSPLRNVTLPSAASSPQRLRSESVVPDSDAKSTPKKGKNKRTSSIMSSVMKQVNLEMQNRSPAPSPIKSSEVINPYSNLQRPIIRPKRPVVKPAPPTKNTTDPAEAAKRKRKIQVCLEGTFDDFDRPDTAGHQDEEEAGNTPTENILQKTMPKEYRQEDTNGPKKKTRQVGKLPERLLKKQKLREQAKSRQQASAEPEQSSSTARIPTDSAPPRLSEKDDKGAIAHVEPPIATGNTSSTAGKATLAPFALPQTDGPSLSAGGRTSSQPAGVASSAQAGSAAAAPSAASASPSGAPLAPAFTSSFSAASLSSFLKTSAPKSALPLFSKPPPTVVLTAPDSEQAVGPTPAPNSLPQPDHRPIVDTVRAMSEQQVLDVLQRDLLRTFPPPPPPARSNPSVQQIVLGFAPSELPDFVLS
ncbi:hypothetical protein PCANC_28573, partial [Puccinia coronata f. sp. avenae]